MKANKDSFSRFGASSNMNFYSSSGKKYSLNDNGLGLKNSLIYVISIGIQKSGGAKELPKMYKDIGKICGKIGQAYPNASEDEIIYKKLGDGQGDGSGATMNAIKANIDGCFDDAASRDVDLLIFHFSDHGSDSGYILLQDGGHYYNSDLAAQFARFKRVFAVLCCCYPWRGTSGGTIVKSANSLPVSYENDDVKSMGDDIVKHIKRIKQQQKQENSQLLKASSIVDTQALIWCAGDANTVTVMYSGVGHLFMWAIEERCNANQTYAEAWNDCKNNSSTISPEEEKMIGVKGTRWSYTYQNSARQYVTVVPHKVNYNNFDENARIFT